MSHYRNRKSSAIESLALGVRKRPAFAGNTVGRLHPPFCADISYEPARSCNPKREHIRSDIWSCKRGSLEKENNICLVKK